MPEREKRDRSDRQAPESARPIKKTACFRASNAKHETSFCERARALVSVCVQAAVGGPRYSQTKWEGEREGRSEREGRPDRAGVKNGTERGRKAEEKPRPSERKKGGRSDGRAAESAKQIKQRPPGDKKCAYCLAAAFSEIDLHTPKNQVNNMLLALRARSSREKRHIL